MGCVGGLEKAGWDGMRAVVLQSDGSRDRSKYKVASRSRELEYYILEWNGMR
jgi:hypothetical protein